MTLVDVAGTVTELQMAKWAPNGQTVMRKMMLMMKKKKGQQKSERASEPGGSPMRCSLCVLYGPVSRHVRGQHCRRPLHEQDNLL